MNSTGATHTLTILEAHLGADHPNIATLVNNLGNVLQDLGDLRGVDHPEDGDGNGTKICDIGAYETLPTYGVDLPIVMR